MLYVFKYEILNYGDYKTMTVLEYNKLTSVDAQNKSEYYNNSNGIPNFGSIDIDKCLDIVKRIKDRIGNNPLYISIDIDVLDPAHAPGTGTPEVAGMTTREILNVLRGLAGSRLVSADVVEVAPAYDHAELTSTAAATIVYELVNLIARSPK